PPILILLPYTTLFRSVEIIGLTEKPAKTTVTGVEMFRKLLEYAEAGDNIGALLRGVTRDDVTRGQVLAQPGTITPHTKFKAEIRSEEHTSELQSRFDL